MLKFPKQNFQTNELTSCTHTPSFVVTSLEQETAKITIKRLLLSFLGQCRELFDGGLQTESKASLARKQIQIPCSLDPMNVVNVTQGLIIYRGTQKTKAVESP
jgi:hypothetical protein